MGEWQANDDKPSEDGQANPRQISLPPGSGLWTAAALVVSLGVLVLQLYPFNFQADTAGSFLSLVRRPPSAVFTQIAMFIPLGAIERVVAQRVLGALASHTAGVVVATLDALLLALLCEAAQLWLPGRTSSLIDLCAAGLGGVIGAMFTEWVWHRRSR